MNGLRGWMLLLAVVSFLAGTAAGLVMARGDAPAPSTEWMAYGERLAADFDLDEERRAALRLFLDQYASDLALVRARYEGLLQAQMEPELRALGERYEGYIRDHVLPPGQRARYDRLNRPFVLAASGGR